MWTWLTKWILTHFIHDLDRVESQLYSDSKFMKLLQKIMRLWHFQTFRGQNEKLRKCTLKWILTHFIHDLDRVESQLYSDSKFMKLLQKIMRLWHFQTFRGQNEKLRKCTLKICIILLNDQHRLFMNAPNVTLTLKLTFRQYPAIHTNYIISHCITLQYNHNICHDT